MSVLRTADGRTADYGYVKNAVPEELVRHAVSSAGAGVAAGTEQPQPAGSSSDSPVPEEDNWDFDITKTQFVTSRSDMMSGGAKKSLNTETTRFYRVPDTSRIIAPMGYASQGYYTYNLREMNIDIDRFTEDDGVELLSSRKLAFDIWGSESMNNGSYNYMTVPVGSDEILVVSCNQSSTYRYMFSHVDAEGCRIENISTPVSTAITTSSTTFTPVAACPHDGDVYILFSKGYGRLRMTKYTPGDTGLTTVSDVTSTPQNYVDNSCQLSRDGKYLVSYGSATNPSTGSVGRCVSKYAFGTPFDVTTLALEGTFWLPTMAHESISSGSYAFYITPDGGTMVLTRSYSWYSTSYTVFEKYALAR